MILKCDRAPALRRDQEEVKRKREAPTLLGNSDVGDSQANGAAERAAQALGGEQVRVCLQRLEGRLGVKLRSCHPVIAWMVEHAADVLSKCEAWSGTNTY